VIDVCEKQISTTCFMGANISSGILIPGTIHPHSKQPNIREVKLSDHITRWENRGAIIDNDYFACIKSLLGIVSKVAKLESQHLRIVVIGKNNGDKRELGVAV
jgi:hypothetical protein